MLGAADVAVHRPPGLLQLGRPGGRGVLGVQEAEIVPAGARPLRHRVGLALGGTGALGALGIHPIRDVGQGGLAGAAGFVVRYFWKPDGQLVLRDGNKSALLTMHDRDRFTPIALSRKQPIP